MGAGTRAAPTENAMTTDLAVSYRAAERVARRRARNFYYSFVVLPPEKRRALCAVYAFMRYCDDISDGAATVENKRVMLERWRQRLVAVLKGDYRGSDIFPAFHDTVRRSRSRRTNFTGLFDGLGWIL